MTAASQRDRFRRIAYRYRNLPGRFGLREHTVETAVGTWSGTYTGDGTEIATWTEITELGGYPPKVRWANDEEVALGSMPRGTAIVGPVTPQHSTGGTASATMTGTSATVGQTFLYRITGPRHPDGAIYELLDFSDDHALHRTIRLRPIADAPQ